MSLFFALALALQPAQTPSVDPYANETKAQRDARMKWFREARFGMFIHWGVYSVPAGIYDGKPIGGIGEWIMNSGRIPVDTYQAYAKSFNPVKYDADAWVRLAKQAGMKYIVITSKHHDGFAMYDTKASSWGITHATPFRRDPLKELAAACRKHGMRLGFYYSQAQDWNHPGGAAAGGHWDPKQDGDMDAYLRDVAVPQVREILTNYGPVACLWWDTPVGMTKARADMLLPLLRLQPGIIHNNRLGGGYRGDTETPEQFVPATGYPGRDWETCMTMNDTWGFKSDDHNWKSPTVLIRNLVDIASKGGNYLLNVGPTQLGEIPGPSVERLRAVGDWMKRNGKAIYATSPSPFKRLPWGRCTKVVDRGGATLYLHVFDWPKDGRLVVPGLRNAVAGASMLVGGRAVPAAVTPEGVVLTLPRQAPDAISSTVVLRVRGELRVENPVLTQALNGGLAFEPNDAAIHGHQLQSEGDAGRENLGFWTDPADWAEWNFRVVRLGRYALKAEIASEGTGSFTLELAGQRLAVTAPNTGSYRTYVPVSLGVVSLPSPGPQTLTLRAVASGWQPLNLRKIVLTPMAGR